MKRFEINNTYATRSAIDADHVIWAKVIKRTEKTAVIETRLSPVGKRVKIYRSHNGDYEYLMPWGRYSMAPCIIADEVLA